MFRLVGAKRFDPGAALDRAMRVFWSRGFAGASAQNLVEAMAINRGGLYATFGRTRDLYLRALGRDLERDREMLAASLRAGEGVRDTLAELLGDYADRLVAAPRRKGCFFVNACVEADHRDDVLMRRLQAEIDAQQALLRRFLEEARARGETPASVDADSRAAFLVGAIHGLRTVGRVTADRDRLERMITVILDAAG